MKVVFAGTSDFALPSLAALLNSEHEICAVYTQPDRPSGRGQKLAVTPVKQMATLQQLPIYQPESLDNGAVQQQVKDFQADIMVDVAYGLFIPNSILEMFKYGCINVHPSLLPRWRGAAPVERAIIAGDKTTGVTIMQVDSGWDTGDILLQREAEILSYETGGELTARLAQFGAELLLQTMQGLVKGTIVAKAQDEALSCYAKKIEKREAELDWNLRAEELVRVIRAFNPKPVAYSTLDGVAIRIWKAEALEQIEKHPAGLIIKADKRGIDVATGNGILRLLELQMPGAKILTVEQMLNSKREMFTSGKKFHA